MSERFIRGALVRGLVQLGIANNTAYEMRPFTPPADGSLYYVATNMPADRRVMTLGDAGYDAVYGVFQVTVNGPSGQGVTALEEAAAAITSLFSAGRRYQHHNQHLIVERSHYGQVRPDGARAKLDVSIFWRGTVFRNTEYNGETYYLLDDLGNVLTAVNGDQLTWR